jgi:hypothetical protein
MNHQGSIEELVGFTLGHALWNTCDFEEGEMLCPLAFIETEEGRELLRFEAESQEEAIENAYQNLSEKEGLTSWALAREGVLNSASGRVEVILVDAWTGGMESPVVFAQQYEPNTGGAFALLGPPLVIENGTLKSEGVEHTLAALKRGVQAHEKAAELWESWGGW